MECPKCGKELRQRAGAYGAFLGCSGYPRCKYTAKLSGQQKFAKPVVAEDKAAGGEQKERVWSKYQLAVFDWLLDRTNRHCVVNACAGSGKTTLLCELVRRIAASSVGARVLILAFNKSIVAELVARRLQADVATAHGFGFRSLKRAFPGVKVGLDKYRRLVEQAILGTDKEGRPTHQERQQRSDAIQLMELAQCYLVEDVQSIAQIAVHHGMAVDQRSIDVASRLLGILRSAMHHVVCSFSEQVWLPVVMDLRIEQYDYVLIDEGQDINTARFQLAVRALAANGRLCVVGDNNQAIYGFTGADCESLNKISAWGRENGGCAEYMLPVTYRCGRAIVEAAREDVPHLEAREGAQDGAVEWIETDAFVDSIQAGDMALCRTNAPLVNYCLALIRSGKKAGIVGSYDIAEYVVNIVKQLAGKETRIANIIPKVDRYRDIETEKLDRVHAPDSMVEKVNDLCDTILALADGLEYLSEFEARIVEVFKNDKPAIKMSSIHRSKGLESSTVYILRPDLLPHPSAKQPWEQQQEKNLRYVARTRAIDRLVYVRQKAK